MAFVREGAPPDEVNRHARTANHASAFLAKAEVDLQAADQAIAAGRYRTALASLEKLVQDDHALARHIKSQSDASDYLQQCYEQRQRAELNRLAGSHDAKKFVSDLAEYVKKDTQALAAKNKSKVAPEPVEQLYLAFPGVLSHRTERCAEAAQLRLNEAKALADQGKATQAKLALQKLSLDATGLDAGKQAADLLKEMNTRKPTTTQDPTP